MKSKLDKLFESSSRRIYSKGATIYQEGERVNGIYRVLKGRVKLWNMGLSNTRSLIFYFVFEEDVFCLIDLFNREGKRRSSATAMDFDTTVEFIPNFTIEILLRRDPLFCLELSVFLKRNYHSILDRYAELQTQDINKKVWKALSKIANEKGTIIKGGHILKSIKHQDLSDYIGISRQSVSLAIQNLKEAGLIKYNREYIFVKK